MIHLKEDDDQRIKNRILRDTDVPLMVNHVIFNLNVINRNCLNFMEF